MLRSHVSRIVLSLVGVVLSYIAGLYVREHYGIAVIIQNASGKSLRQVSVKVEPTGRMVSVGHLAPAEHRRVFVTPQTESHISLEYTDAGGQPHVETVVGYVEAGYCGKAEVTVLPEEKVTSKETIDPVMCWNSWLGFL
jgi:hypothetical protein